jgi:uncharacterized protein (DUF2141 family)
MNYKLICTLLIVLAVATTIFSQDSAKVDEQTGDLTLNIMGFENDEGSVKIALSNSKEDYTTKGQAFQGAIEVISNKTAHHIFEEIPFGIYAIKIFHDENNDGELDTNFLGIPSEDYGFSNNAKGNFGPASWEDAQFTFGKDSMIVEINID